MQPLVSGNLWGWIQENAPAFQPPVGNKVLWDEFQFTAMLIHGPTARRDFHLDPYDEVFYQLKGDIVVEHLDKAGKRISSLVREGEVFLMPAMVPHSPHRPADTWGLV